MPAMTHTSGTTILTLPRRPLTRDDLEAMPDDGRRYELIDGTLVVSPGPVPLHRVVGRLFRLLDDACSLELDVLPGVDVALARDTLLIPDVVVGRVDEMTARELPTAPVLAVEVLSPSTRRIDLLLKRSRLEAAGCPSYWLVDPEEPSLTVLELRKEHYVEVARVAGNEAWTATKPCPVTVVPSALVAPRH